MSEALSLDLIDIQNVTPFSNISILEYCSMVLPLYSLNLSPSEIHRDYGVPISLHTLLTSMHSYRAELRNEIFDRVTPAPEWVRPMKVTSQSPDRENALDLYFRFKDLFPFNPDHYQAGILREDLNSLRQTINEPAVKAGSPYPELHLSYVEALADALAIAKQPQP